MSDAGLADAVIIGSGQAGPALAVALAQVGERVVLVEGHQLGGSCVNSGCTPTKTLRKSARVAHLARTAPAYGVKVGRVDVDFAAAMSRMQARVEAARSGLESWIGGQENLRLVRGWGQFAGREGELFLVRAGEEPLRARRVYLNTGTRPFIPPIPGLDRVPFLDNESLLRLRDLPRHLVILGGSYIGLEMGQIFRRLGAEVTIVEADRQIMSREDEQIAAAVEAIFLAEGIAVRTGVAVRQVDGSDNAVRLRLADGTIVEGSHLLVATGRLPNSERLNLGSIGLATDERGFVTADPFLRTSVSGVWSLGDLNRRGAFTHTSYDDHEIVLGCRRLEQGGPGWRNADERILAYAMYTDPPLGRVGLSVREGRQQVRNGRKLLLAEWAMKDVSRAKEEGETEGRITLLVDAVTERFVGASFLGINGDEIVQVISQAMAGGVGWRTVQQALPIHPTVTEFLPTILGRLMPLEP